MLCLRDISSEDWRSARPSTYETQTAKDYHRRSKARRNKGQAKAMKGVNKGPGKAATNRAFADSDEDGGNHLALMMMRRRQQRLKFNSRVHCIPSHLLHSIMYIYSVLLPIQLSFKRRIRLLSFFAPYIIVIDRLDSYRLCCIDMFVIDRFFWPTENWHLIDFTYRSYIIDRFKPTDSVFNYDSIGGFKPTDYIRSIGSNR